MTRRLLAAALLVVAAACTRETGDVSQNTPSNSTPASSQLPQETESNASKLNPAAPQELDNPTARVPTAVEPSARVELQEYQIRMEPKLKAGKHTFTVVNSGKEQHAFDIEQNGAHILQTPAMSRGDSRTVEVDLKPGTYTVYCPVEGHKGKGMTMTLEVQ